MIIMPAGAGIVLAVILIAVFWKQIGSLFSAMRW